jgi:hypothetical protein
MSAETGPSSARTTGIYPWRRFWAARDGVIDLSDGGFLVDPESERGCYSVQKLYTLADLEHYRALALLGEPGIGKSVALETEYKALQQQSGAGAAVQSFVDLRSFVSDLFLHSRVFASPEFLAWEAGNSDLALYLDSLDEALLRIDTVAGLLADELPQHPTTRLSVRIACRTFAWPHAPLETAFQKIWGDAAVGVFELAPLRRKDVADAAVQRRIDPERFIDEVQNANAVPFAIKPLTLNLLFRLYERDGSLPSRRLDLYAEGCLSLCEEHSANRRGARRVGNLNGKQRYRLAGRLAAVTILANRYAIWTDPITEGRPDEDVPLAELSTGTETGDFQPFDASDDNIREVLDTGLFSSRGPARIGWAHQSYAEFLAANYLVSKHTAPENMLKMLCHPSGGLVPQLWMVAAWVASLDPELRRLLIAQEPFTLLRGDLLSWTPEDLATLTQALLTTFQEQRAHDFSWGIASEYRKLAHPGLADQLRPFITDASRNVIARRAALMIARACGLGELRSEILAIALDPMDESSIRAQAVSALETCGDEATIARLMPLVQEELGVDPNHEIKGRALELLWPEHLKSAELFTLITPPDDGFVGAYVMFVTRELPASLTADDFVPALEWATAYACTASLTSQFQAKQTADAILVGAWPHADTPAVMRAFVGYVSVVLRHAHQLFMSAMRRDDEEFREQIRGNVHRRQQFLLTVLAREPLQSHEGFTYRRAGFLDKGRSRVALVHMPHRRRPNRWPRCRISLHAD